MEPRPLLDEGATEIERALLCAGRADGPRKDAASRVLAAIHGLPPAPGLPAIPNPGHGVESGLAGADPAASLKPAALIKWAKLALVAVGVGGAVAVTYYLAQPHGVVPSATPARSMVPETVPLLVPGEARATGKTPTSPEAREGLTTAGEEPHALPGEDNARGRRASPTGRTLEATHEGSASPLDRSLADETRALDRAREALDAHRTSEVLRLLDEYHRRFAHGRLRPEAMVLRLAALVQAGRYGAAESLASQLLAEEAYQAYAPRIRSLLRETKQ
jgi:hypothetical protein